MNRKETTDLLQLIDVYSPGFGSEDRLRALIAVWGMQLGDVAAADATAAVHAHYAMESRWISTADIRRRVASRRDLLPPDPETAYAQACEFNRWLSHRTGPEPDIHPAALETARKIRWSTFDAPPGVAHRQFVDAYRPAAEEATEQALTGNLAELGSRTGVPKALPAGTGVEAAASEERARAPIDHAAAEKLKAQIRASGIGRLPAPPRPEYAPPTEAEIERWSEAFRQWAAEQGHAIEIETVKEAS